jgi:cysteinyl-tRNA synthetase
MKKALNIDQQIAKLKSHGMEFDNEEKAKEISEHYLKVFKNDLKKMNISEPDFWPKATEHIKEQIEMIKKLEKKDLNRKVFEERITK